MVAVQIIGWSGFFGTGGQNGHPVGYGLGGRSVFQSGFKVSDKAAGIFNVGCGFPVAAGDIAGWVIEGFGRGRVVSGSDEIRDAFFLNTSRLQDRTGLSLSPDALRDRCREIGRRLAGA